MPKIRIKRGTTTQWSNSLTPLTGGELGYDTISKVIKIGDGTTLWNDLLPLNKFEIDEISQDAIYDALTNFIGIGNNITVEYNDVDNYMVLDVGPNVVLQDDLVQSVLDQIGQLTTDSLEEGTVNVYWTESRTKEAAAELLVNSTQSNITITGNGAGLTISAQGGLAGSTTDNLTEGSTNLYFTDERALDATVLAYDAIGSASTAQSNAISSANEYTDLAVSGLGNSIGDSYVPQSDVGAEDGVAQLIGGYVPDSQISPSIARDSELFSGSYNDLSDKPNIALGAVQWTANHTLLPGGENTRYLIGDIVYDGGKIYVANYENESIPTSSTLYWSEIGSGKRLNIDGRDIPNITYDQLKNKPTLFDGSYLSLTNQPTLFSGAYDDLTGKPSIFSGAYDDLIGKPDLTVYSAIDSPTFTGTATTDDLVVNGDFTINGTNFAASATSITIEDNLVQLAHQNPANTVDLGIVVSYNDGSAKHAGIVRDASANKWKLFKGVVTEPSTTVDFTEGSLDDLEVAGFTASSATINNPNFTGSVYATDSTITAAQFVKPYGTSSQFLKADGSSDSTVYATAAALDLKPDLTVSTNQQSSSYTLQSSDLGKLIEMSGGGSVTISDSPLLFPVGFTCDILQTGPSQVVVAGNGFTPNGTPGVKLRAQWSSATLIKRSLNSWVVLGDLSA